MAGLPEFANNPIQAGNYGQNGDKSLEIALASKMQLQLDQPMTDVDSGLCNRDFEGDFFKLGDTVAIIKPDLDSLTIEFGKAKGGIAPVFGEIGDSEATAVTTPTGKVGYSNKDAMLIPGNVRFEKNIMTIDRYTKYAFYISDLTKAEGKWNYESGNLDAVASELRKRHNLETCQMIVDHNNDVTAVAEVGSIPSLESTAEAPIVVANGDELYEKVIVPIYATLYDAGAITADGQVSYGSNPTQAKQTFGKIYMPTKAYTTLLVSKYLQDRATVAADEKVKTGQLKTVMGLDVAVEPSLNPKAHRHVSLPVTAAEDTIVIIAGTRNLVTKAGKVLPPKKFESHQFFATEYHGMEIYGKKVIEPKAGVVVFVKIAAGV